MNEIDVLELKHQMQSMAELLRHFYTQLRQQGFTPFAALVLTRDYQKHVMTRQE